MLYLYDNAIVEDLRDSFNITDNGKPVVCVVPPEDIISIAAQVQDDEIHFPMIAVARENNIPVDNELSNFTRLHQGVATTFDNVKNEIYYEKAIPLKLSYNLVCMGTNTADVDELLREIIGRVVVRNRKFGDRIQLRGRNFTSSIKKLINEKVPAAKRNTLHFMEDSIGTFFAENIGIAQRVAPDCNTKRYLIVSVKKTDRSGSFDTKKE